jgi:hypothetical protein
MSKEKELEQEERIDNSENEMINVYESRRMKMNE